ncbi:MAG: type II toxin-antitoxin system VapC family toxin [Caulobacteraceae bacterium]|nr:type II toxin-antitoxin system VapC family toxin [Caulobacteraceae bacterium]
MSLYLDASVLLPILIHEPSSPRIDRFMAEAAEPLLVSEFAAAETASALSRLIRIGHLNGDDAKERLLDFDAWRATETSLVDVESADVRSAAVIVRRFELRLRAPDALHLAISRRLDAVLVTLDIRLAQAAHAIDLPVIQP